jgi:hypothetical protein
MLQKCNEGRELLVYRCICAAHVTAPTQLPSIISAVNHPYSRHTVTSCRRATPIRHQRKNILPLATALMQYAATWGVSNSHNINRNKQQRKRRNYRNINRLWRRAGNISL